MAIFHPENPKVDKIVTTVRIDKAFITKIDKIIMEEGNKMSRNEFINQCIKFALDHYGLEDEE